MTFDVRLIAICDPGALGPDALETARRVEAGGATLLQIRMKNSRAREILRWTERLSDALAIPVFVNDRVDVAWAAGAAGVHLGAADLPSGPIRAATPAGFGIGVSVGDAREAARALEGSADYWSVGAVFATGTKPDAGAPIGVAGFRAVRARAPAAMPVVAIGGITAERAAEVCAAGAAGVAVAAALFGARDPEAAARAVRAAVDAAGRPR